MKTVALAVWGVLAVSQLVRAEETTYPLAKVNYGDFSQLVAEVAPHRQQRLVDLDTFLKMSRQPDVVVLDTRSAFRYERIHLQGAKHLSFTDFTQDNLAQVIPSPDTTILIYCNNNFDGNQIDFASKVALPLPRAGLKQAAAARRPATPAAQMAVQEKPLMLALNVPTYITLYGYGYHNIYELHELVNVSDPRVTFEGSIVAENRPAVVVPKSKAE